MWDLPGPGLEPVSHALADGYLTTVPPGKSLDQIYFLNLLNSFLSWQRGEEIPQRPEMMRGQESRGISKDAGADICLGFNGQQVPGTEVKARTLEGDSIIVQSRKSAPALQRERMIKESHAYFISGRKERKRNQKVFPKNP